jgi:hypothetical protein
VKKCIPNNQSESRTKTDEKPLWMITATACYIAEIEGERRGIVITADEVSRRP